MTVGMVDIIMLHVSGIKSFSWLPLYFLYCFLKEDVSSALYGCLEVSDVSNLGLTLICLQAASQIAKASSKVDLQVRLKPHGGALLCSLH